MPGIAKISQKKFFHLAEVEKLADQKRDNAIKPDRTCLDIAVLASASSTADKDLLSASTQAANQCTRKLYSYWKFCGGGLGFHSVRSSRRTLELMVGVRQQKHFFMFAGYGNYRGWKET